MPSQFAFLRFAALACFLLTLILSCFQRHSYCTPRVSSMKIVNFVGKKC